MKPVTLDKVFNLLSAILTIAIVALIIKSPYTSKIIKAFGDFFTQSIKAAKA